MYCSNKQFVSFVYQAWIPTKDIFDSLGVVKHLFARWWSMLSSVRVQDTIASASPAIAKLIQVLYTAGKLNAKSIKDLMHHFSQWHKTATFAVHVSWWHNDLIEKKLRDDFWDIAVEYADWNTLGMHVAGKWHVYKRSLDADLKKIMK